MLGDPASKPPRGAYTLLDGLALCRCGNTVASSVNATGKNVYRCNTATRGHRADPHCQQMAASVDAYVQAVIVERRSRDDITDLIATPATVDTAALYREAAAIRANLNQSAADAMLNWISRDEHLAASAAGRRRLEEIAADLEASAAGSALAPFAAAESACVVWDGLDTARKRAVIEALTPVIIHPAGRGARSFNPATVIMPWQQDRP